MGVDPRPRLASAEAALRCVMLRDLVIQARIGVHEGEKRAAQRVRINLELAVREGEGAIGDRLASVYDYEPLVEGVRRIVASGHVNLVETLAERIAALCLADARVRIARVRVEKLDLFPDAVSVGVEIERVSRLP